MTADFSAWNGKQTALEVVQAYTESGIIPDTSFMRTIGREPQSIFPAIAAAEAVNQNETGSDLADSSNTETAITLSPDAVLKRWQYIPMSAISLNQNVSFLNAYNRRVGADLREAHDKRIAAFATITAINSGTVVIFDDQATGSAVTAALKDGVKSLDENNVPQTNRTCLFAPGQLTKTYDQTVVRDGTWMPGADSRKNLVRLPFLGCDVISANLIFNTNTASNTNYANKYRYNFAGATPYYGVMWQAEGLAVQYFEEPNVKTSLVEEKECYLVLARMIMGTAATRGKNFVTFRGN